MIDIIVKRKFLAGTFLLILGIFLPYFLDINTFHIIENFSRAIEGDTLYLFVAAVLLVILNSIRAFPHYIGAFFIAESIKFKKNTFLEEYSKPIIILILIPSVYAIINSMGVTKYHFGLPAVIMVILVALIGKKDYNYVSDWKKISLIIFTIIGIQFLDIIPALDFLPIGKGETSTDVKLIAKFMDYEDEMNIIGILFFVQFMLFSFLFFRLILDENRLKAVSKLKEENYFLENETRMKNLENRSLLEVKQLVHDLKTPLTSVQVLLGLVKEKVISNGLSKEEEYLSKMEDTLDNMGKMISEVLNEDVKFNISTEAILNYTLANISKAPYSQFINVENNAPDAYVFVNKIMFSRAVANVIENAGIATGGTNGRIDITVDRIVEDDMKMIRFSVKDNGVGIKMEDIDKIWENGYSSRGSYGLGLGFVRQVIENSDGKISVESVENIGTRVSIFLKEETNG